MGEALYRRAHRIDAPAIDELVVRSHVDSQINPSLGQDRRWADDTAAAMLEGTAEAILAAKIAAAEAQPERYLFEVAEVGARVGGVVFAEKGAYGTEIYELVVAQENRGQGIGSHLMKELLEWHDAELPAHVTVVADNDSARRFYYRQGFREIPHSLETTATYAVLDMELPPRKDPT